MEIDRKALEEWQRNQPLSILQLDPADRAVLLIAGKTNDIFVCDSDIWNLRVDRHKKAFDIGTFRYPFFLSHAFP